MKRSVICAINSTPPTPSSRIRNSSWFINWGHRKFLEVRSSEIGLYVMERADSDVGRRDHRHAAAESQLVIEQLPHRVSGVGAVVVGAGPVNRGQFPVCLA